MKISIIGHFGGKKKCNDGQTVKTKEIFSFLIKAGFTVSVIDTYNIKKRPIRFFIDIRNGLRTNDACILIVSSRGYRVIAPYLVRLNNHLKKKIFDFVIGGYRYQLFDRSSKYQTVVSGFNKIYVETERIKREYGKRGIKNVEVIPNFKDLKAFLSKDDYIKKNELHACTFSRVIKEKGISDAIAAIKIANQIDKERKYYLDIYGRIDDGFREEFLSILNEDTIKYVGEVDYDEASKIINGYDVLLFPTYWKGEGFPGTIVDAFFAATPVIATDWNDNFEIMREGKNGIKVKIKSPNDIAKAMNEIAHNKELLKAISKANQKEAYKYEPNEAMQPFLNGIGERSD